MNTPGKASLPVIKRLPKYYRYLRTLKNDGITSISSRELAAQMGTTASQVRQDFNCIGDVNGRQGIGYSVENLLSILEHLLFGNGDLLPTILIGCGRLGKAVSRFITTDTNGYKLIAANLYGNSFYSAPCPYIPPLQCINIRLCCNFRIIILIILHFDKHIVDHSNA